MAKSSASFAPGTTGNPAGRPPFSTARAKFRLAMEPDMPEIRQALANAAKAGDPAAIKLIYDRLIPSVKPTSDDLSIRLTGTLEEKGEAIVAAMLKGRITADQAQAAINVLSAQAKLTEQSEIIKRLDQLEGLVCPTAKP